MRLLGRDRYSDMNMDIDTRADIERQTSSNICTYIRRSVGGAPVEFRISFLLLLRIKFVDFKRARVHSSKMIVNASGVKTSIAESRQKPPCSNTPSQIRRSILNLSVMYKPADNPQGSNIQARLTSTRLANQRMTLTNTTRSFPSPPVSTTPACLFHWTQ